MKELDMYRDKYNHLFVKKTIDYNFNLINDFTNEEEKDKADDFPDVDNEYDEDVIDISAFRNNSNIEIADDPEEHEEDKEDLAMVAESKLYKLVIKDLFEYLKKWGIVYYESWRKTEW